MSITPEIDLNQYNVEQLRALQVALGEEIKRRTVVTSAAEKINKIAKEYKEAMGFVDGDPWVQPEGAYDAYPLGARVTHDGKLWESTTPANVWAPGVSGWRELSSDPAVVPDWVRPTGAHDAYFKGDRVTFEGGVYESTINANVWTPVAYPAGWDVITAPPTPEPPVKPEEPPVTDPEPEKPPVTDPEPSPAEWVQPTGAHDAYNIRDQVMFQGAVYSSKINANTYSPTTYPAGWELVL